MFPKMGWFHPPSRYLKPGFFKVIKLNQKGQWCQLVASVSIARSIKGMINQSGARMFVSCWKFLCNNAVHTKSANHKNNKHLCTKYKCIQIFQNLNIFGNRFWKKRWEKNCTIHHRWSKNWALLFCFCSLLHCIHISTRYHLRIFQQLPHQMVA